MELYEKCFLLLDNLCQPLHGERLATLTIVLNGTQQLNKYSSRIPAQASNHRNSRPTVSSINEWFIAMLTHYSADTTPVLTLFIQSILSRPSLSPGGSEALLANIDICVMYDTAMIRKCNVSCLPFLLELKCSIDVNHRIHCVEFVSRALLVDSECDWQVLREDDANAECREVAMIRILIEKVIDTSGTVKIKAMNGFLRVASAGNRRCKEIFRVN